MFPSSPSTPPETGRPVNQLTSWNSFKSGYDSSLSGDELRVQNTETRAAQSHNRGSKMRWFSQVKDWLSVSEPSADAMKAQQLKTAKRHGVDTKDPKAVSKLHAPSGKLPPNVTTSTAGPSPEKALKKALKERQLRQSFSNASAGTPSSSSRDSFSPSVKDSRRAGPGGWEG